MAFPSEFQYANEADFIERFLIPLLQRLGFSMVVNYHGSSEFGKDLIFAEIDRFGHIRFHALQAKYEPSISLNKMETLISDCKQAFANPFSHPQTGIVERISSFYAVNGGSMSSVATSHYFSSLRSSFGGNVQLLQGKDLLNLDRWASVNRVNSVGERIAGISLEIRFNLEMARVIEIALRHNTKLTLNRLRTDAAVGYLCVPMLADSTITEAVQKYWFYCSQLNNELNFMQQLGCDNIDELRKGILQMVIPNVRALGERIDTSLSGMLRSLGPLSVM